MFNGIALIHISIGLRLHQQVPQNEIDKGQVNYRLLDVNPLAGEIIMHLLLLHSPAASSSVVHVSLVPIVVGTNTRRYSSPNQPRATKCQTQRTTPSLTNLKSAFLLATSIHLKHPSSPFQRVTRTCLIVYA